MRTLLILLSFLIPLTFFTGCGERRPDPRANPDFDESALDPAASGRALSGLEEDPAQR